MNEPAAWLILTPLVGAGAAALLRGRAAAGAALAAAAATLLAAGLLVEQVWTGGAQRHAVGGWGAPLGIDLVLDGLSATMLAATAIGCAAIGVYALHYFPRAARGPRWTEVESFWPLTLLAWAALNAIFLSGDLFNLYVGLELMTLAAVALVALAGDRVALNAAMRYLLAAFVGSLLYLLGVALLYARHHTLDLALLGERLAPGADAWAALALVTTGLALKTALFPLHFWLPRAHASAPPPVSALLSALVVTASFYIVLRIWSVAGAALAGGSFPQLIGAAGAAAIVWGSIQAIRQPRLKIMIAYSTVAQLGYLFLMLPLVLGGDGAAAGAAWSGGVYHAVSHAFAKAAMFMAAGAIVRAMGHDRIVGVRGIASHLPISTYAFGISGLTLIGLPPSGGFVAKWLLLTAALDGGQWWWAVVILAGGVLTAGYVFLVLGQELSQAGTDQPAEFAAVPPGMEYTAMALALFGMALGVRPAEPLQLLELGRPLLAPFGLP